MDELVVHAVGEEYLVSLSKDLFGGSTKYLYEFNTIPGKLDYEVLSGGYSVSVFNDRIELQFRALLEGEEGYRYSDTLCYYPENCSFDARWLPSSRSIISPTKKQGSVLSVLSRWCLETIRYEVKNSF